MIIQAVLLFLLLVVVLGVGGKWLRLPPSRRRQPPIAAAGRCRTCRAYVIGSRPEPCTRPDCPYRRAA